MKSDRATAEVFYTAFKSLGAVEREAFIEKIVGDPSYREDLIDIALIEEAKKDKGRTIPASEYFKRRKSESDS